MDLQESLQTAMPCGLLAEFPVHHLWVEMVLT